MVENKVVIFSGAGISAESGISTYRDSKSGLWENCDPNDVASAKAWKENPEKVIDFHNARLKDIEQAVPNQAHLALAELEEKFRVIIITQNVDDLHERAGSKRVIHLHGMSTQVRTDPTSPDDKPEILERGYRPLAHDELDEQGRRLRPNTVLFGEDMLHSAAARKHLREAGKVMVVGTSLMVEPAASLLKKCHFYAEKIIIGLEIIEAPRRFKICRGSATDLVPAWVTAWKNGGNL